MALRDQLRAEVLAAIGLVTALRSAAAGASRQALAGGLAFYPAVGLACGCIAAALARAAAALGAPLAAVGGVVVLEALAGGRPRRALAAAASALLARGDAAVTLARLRAGPGPVGITVALAALAAKCWAATELPPAGRTVALALAPMLGAWAVVVQCYGGAPTHARGPAAALVGRARFREFGWASVVALGVTLGATDAAGLAVVVAAALVTLGLRVVAHRRLGGLTGRLLGATRELVETVALAAFALLAQLNT